MSKFPRIVSQISEIETIAEGNGIRELYRLRQLYGKGHWRKKKGVAMVESYGGEIAMAEIHWYEAHGIGKVKLKIKRWL